jgi:hypothetical protein
MGLIYYLKKKIAMRRLKKQYPDDEYNCGELQFIWGVTSWDNLLRTPASFYTMNDIEIYYNRYTEMYHLDIELAYRFPDDDAKIAYFAYLLDEFTQFIKQNDYPLYYIGELDWTFPNIKMESESIPGLYTNFKLLVEGYKIAYGGKRYE